MRGARALGPEQHGTRHSGIPEPLDECGVGRPVEKRQIRDRAIDARDDAILMLSVVSGVQLLRLDQAGDELRRVRSAIAAADSCQRARQRHSDGASARHGTTGHNISRQAGTAE